MSPYSSPCYTNTKAHYALIEIYLWKDSYFTGHVACMSYDMLVTMVKKWAFLLKEVTLPFCSMVLAPFLFQCSFREELKKKKKKGRREMRRTIPGRHLHSYFVFGFGKIQTNYKAGRWYTYTSLLYHMVPKKEVILRSLNYFWLKLL